MSPKPEEVLSSIMTPWMMAAVICAALPFLYAAPGLQTTEWFGGSLPLFIALLIGMAVGVSLTAAARRLCGLTGSWRLYWDSLTASAAALTGEQCRWDREAKRLGGLEVEHELELGRAHNRNFAKPLAFEYSTGVDACLPMCIRDAGVSMANS